METLGSVTPPFHQLIALSFMDFSGTNANIAKSHVSIDLIIRYMCIWIKREKEWKPQCINRLGPSAPSGQVTLVRIHDSSRSSVLLHDAWRLAGTACRSAKMPVKLWIFSNCTVTDSDSNVTLSCPGLPGGERRSLGRDKGVASQA